MATTDEDAAMQAKPASAQWRTVEEMQRKGWHYKHIDASGRRIILERGEEECRVDQDGQAKR